MRCLVFALSLLTLSLSVLAPLPAQAAEEGEAQLVVGQLLLKLDQSAKTEEDARALVAALPLASSWGLRLERLSVLDWLVVRVAAKDEAMTHEAAAQLRALEGVRAVEPVTLMRPLLAPDDTLYEELWGFAAIEVEGAWDITVGAASQRIGIVDTGASRSHPDLAASDAGGFDFITDPSVANDGDGRDADYTDAFFGDVQHGSHVAGTIGAVADDGFGVPGINWSAGLIHARALGERTGSNADIMDAVAWLAGLPVPGVPPIGANRVSVINLSLGSVDECSEFEREIVNDVLARGIVIVAAAGNEGNHVPTGSPANCPGVIAVGASDAAHALAPYSNFDQRIDVVAPGGNGADARTAILSVDGASASRHAVSQGTSMASPHVAGVVSLMQSVNPALSPRQIRELLARSPYTCRGCDNKPFLNAPAAVLLAQQTPGELGDNPPTSGCPANAEPAPEGCVCLPGFTPNHQLGQCVPVDEESCVENSSPNADGTRCTCDAGFVADATRACCVSSATPDAACPAAPTPAPPDRERCEPPALLAPDPCGDDRRCVDGVCVADGEQEEDEDDDDDDDDRRSGSYGCAAAGPGSILPLWALLSLLRRRPRHRRC